MIKAKPLTLAVKLKNIIDICEGADGLIAEQLLIKKGALDAGRDDHGIDPAVVRKVLAYRKRKDKDPAETQRIEDLMTDYQAMLGEGRADARPWTQADDEMSRVMALTNTDRPPKIEAIKKALGCSQGKAQKLRAMAAARLSKSSSSSSKREHEHLAAPEKGETHGEAAGEDNRAGERPADRGDADAKVARDPEPAEASAATDPGEPERVDARDGWRAGDEPTHDADGVITETAPQNSAPSPVPDGRVGAGTHPVEPGHPGAVESTQGEKHGRDAFETGSGADDASAYAGRRSGDEGGRKAGELRDGRPHEGEDQGIAASDASAGEAEVEAQIASTRPAEPIAVGVPSRPEGSPDLYQRITGSFSPRPKPDDDLQIPQFLRRSHA